MSIAVKAAVDNLLVNLLFLIFLISFFFDLLFFSPHVQLFGSKQKKAGVLNIFFREKNTGKYDSLYFRITYF
ncbi:MAG TPA: hypothetical protein DCW47_00280 [Lachnospiraceae bacterium]|nr:hypothetical protein [Lachnospiraceae bacterium]